MELRCGELLANGRRTDGERAYSPVVGVLRGEGVGPEVVEAALEVLAALDATCRTGFEVRHGGPIGIEAEAVSGRPLTKEVTAFCEDVFAAGGAVLSGPGCGRFVYDLRTRFDLFYKLSPLRVANVLSGAGRLRREHVRGVDVLLVRENASGFYHGQWAGGVGADGRRHAEHRLDATETNVRRVLAVAAGEAARRSGRLSVVVKSAGIPSLSELWRDCALESAAEAGVDFSLLEIDYAAYCLIQHPRELDVVAAPDLFGDVLADLGGVLVGSRGLTYSGNFSGNGAAVYQTNHGAAYDLAGTDRANPAGQILSLAMLLRLSLGLEHEANLVEEGLRATWRAGWRTADLVQRGCRIAGTREFGQRVCESVAVLARS
jgi:3-isopropylmalate dehydrogenase